MKPMVVFALIWAWAPGAISQQPSVARMVEESRSAAGKLVQKIRQDAIREMGFTGPTGAILVGKYSSMETAAAVSRSNGWRVSRVSLKPRNAGTGSPDVWEQNVLAEFERRVSRGEPADALEYSEVVNEPMGRYFRYMKALPVQPACLRCHGTQENMSGAVRRRLAAEYPFDKALDYQVGQVRGAVSIKRPY